MSTRSPAAPMADLSDLYDLYSSRVRPHHSHGHSHAVEAHEGGWRGKLVYAEAQRHLDAISAVTSITGPTRALDYIPDKYFSAERMEKALQAVTLSFYARFAGNEPPVESYQLLGSLSAEDRSLNSHLASLVIDLAARVSALELRVAAQQLPPTLQPNVPPASTREDDLLLPAVRGCFGAIIEAFHQAFGDHPVKLTVEKILDDTFAARVSLDASSADREQIGRARAEGARSTFYELVVEAVPTEILDRIDFSFVFP